MPGIVETKDLRKVYRVGKEKVVALSNINISVQRGEICCVLGTSGSGKSTLLNMLAGLEKPTHGQVFLGGVDITRLNERRMTKFRQKYVGFIFQGYNLMNDLSAIENVAMPLTFRGMGKRKRNFLAKRMLYSVGLGDRIRHKPKEMSGGQQQRVGIARAYVSRPKIIFADEPTGNLDTKTTRTVMQLMIEMAKKFSQTLIIVTHDTEIARYCDRIITIVDGSVISDVVNQDVKDGREDETDKIL